ncbi:MAG TPA: putative lipid II flippase FtsW [Acidimicrobiales bacterium]|jgi:cell division protein FtsW
MNLRTETRTRSHRRSSSRTDQTQNFETESRSTSNKKRPRRPPAPTGYVVLLALIVVLNLIGLVMVLSASSVTALQYEGSSYYYFERQVLWVFIGSILTIALLNFDYRRLRKLALPMVALSAVMLVVVLVPGLGSNVNGSSRWIGVGMFSIQPSEFAKLAMLIFAADLLARRRAWIGDTRVTLRPVIVAFAVFAALIMLQPNLGTTIVLAAITFTILFVAGVPLGPLAGWGLAGCCLAGMASMGESYRRARILAFLHPWNDPLNTGYQTIQSQVSVASGGWLGVGLGASKAKWGFLPYAHTDFIFAIIAEELGLVGAIVVVALFVALGVFGVRAGLRTSDPFARLLAIGITTWFCVQAFVNIGAVLGILPITGVPLPFISFGGSSVLATMAASGILLNVARNAPGYSR